MIDIGQTGKIESTGQHQSDLILLDKGANKFSPQVGVGIRGYIDDEYVSDEMIYAIRKELVNDGMTIGSLSVTTDGKLNIEASYENN